MITGLLDLRFTRFVTLRVLSVLYVAVVALDAVVALTLLSRFLIVNSLGSVLTGLVVAPLVFVVSTLVARVVLELVAVVFRLAQDVRAVREHLTATG